MSVRSKASDDVAFQVAGCQKVTHGSRVPTVIQPGLPALSRNRAIVSTAEDRYLRSTTLGRPRWGRGDNAPVILTMDPRLWHWWQAKVGGDPISATYFLTPLGTTAYLPVARDADLQQHVSCRAVTRGRGRDTWRIARLSLLRFGHYWQVSSVTRTDSALIEYLCGV